MRDGPCCRRDLLVVWKRPSPGDSAIRPRGDPILPILLDFSPGAPSPGRTVAMDLGPLVSAAPPMHIHATRPLFAWSELEDTPQLRTLREVLASLPDGPLLDG